MRLRAGGFLLLLDRSRAGGRGRSCSINASGMPALRFPMTHLAPRYRPPEARGGTGDGCRGSGAAAASAPCRLANARRAHARATSLDGDTDRL